MVSSLQVVVSNANGLRESRDRRYPDVIADLRIIEKHSSRKPDAVSTVVTPKSKSTVNPEFNETITLQFQDDPNVVYQLEVTLWDVGGYDKQKSNPDNFLGEVLLNIGKLKPWDGIYLEQVFDLRQVATLDASYAIVGGFAKNFPEYDRDLQGQHGSAPSAQGKLFMKLKYQSSNAPARPVGLSLVLHENWESVVTNLDQFEYQLRQDVINCLRTDAARVEVVGSEPRKTQVQGSNAQFYYPVMTHVNLHLPVEAGRDNRPVQELEAQMLAMLKDTRSELYAAPVACNTREIQVHEPYRKTTAAPQFQNPAAVSAPPMQSPAPPPQQYSGFAHTAPAPPPAQPQSQPYGPPYGPPRGIQQPPPPPGDPPRPPPSPPTGNPPPPPKSAPPPPPPGPAPGEKVPFSSEKMITDVDQNYKFLQENTTLMDSIRSSAIKRP